MLEAPPAAVAEPQRLRILEGSAGADELRFALLRHGCQALRQPIDDLEPVIADAGDVELRRAEVEAQRLSVADIGDQLGDVQERLGRDAADVQARAAGPLA